MTSPTIITAAPMHGAHSYDLDKLKRDAGLSYDPTPFIYEMMKAVGGEGPRAYDWADKPHRLIYDACREIARLEDEVKRLKETCNNI